MTGFLYQMPAIFRKRGTLTPPAFKSLCHRRNINFFWDTGILYAIACVTVVECMQKPCMVLYGISTKSID